MAAVAPIAPVLPARQRADDLDRIAGVPEDTEARVSRERLLSRVSWGLARTRFALICGPAQSGKTTLLRQWAAKQGDATGLYLSIGRGPQSETQFWRRASQLAGLQNAGGDYVAFANFVESRIRPFHLLIDDMHQAGPALTADIAQLVSQCPQLVVIATTAMSQLPTGTGKRAMQVVAAHDLEFTREELRALLAGWSVTYDEAFLRSLLQRFEGTVTAGLADELAGRLSAVRGVTRMTPAVAAILTETEDAHAAHLAGRLSPPASQLLRALAPVQHMDAAALSAAHSALDLPSSTCEELERNGTGTWSLSADGETFEIDSTLKRALTRSCQTVGHSKLHAAWDAIADAKLRSGDYLGAASLAAAAGRWPMLTAVLTEGAAHIFRAPAPELHRITASIPQRALFTNPALALLTALVDASRYGSAPTRVFALIEERARAQLVGTEPGEQSRLNLIRLVALRRSAAIQRSLALATRLTEEIDGQGDGAVASETLLQAAYCRLAAGDYAAVAEGLRRFGSGADCTHLATLRAAGLAALGTVLDGRVREAARLTETFRLSPLWSTIRHTVLGVPHQLALGFIAAESGDEKTARRAVRTLDQLGIELEERPLRDLLAALCETISGQISAGLATTDAYRVRRTELSANWQACVIAARADLLTLNQRPLAALALARDSQLETPVLAGATGRALLAAGKPAKALLWIEQWLNGDRLSARQRVENLLVKAAATQHLSKDHSQTNADLREAQSLSAEYGLRVPWMLSARCGLPLSPPEDDSFLHSWLGRHAGQAGPRPHAPQLTRRERVILSCLASERTIPEIAAHLVVSPQTVKSQVRSIYRKLGARSRGDAIRIASEGCLL